MNQTENNRPLVDGVPALERKLKEVREAQAQFATFSQEQVDQIFRAAALAAAEQPVRPDAPAGALLPLRPQPGLGRVPPLERGLVFHRPAPALGRGAAQRGVRAGAV